MRIEKERPYDFVDWEMDKLKKGTEDQEDAIYEMLRHSISSRVRENVHLRDIFADWFQRNSSLSGPMFAEQIRKGQFETRGHILIGMLSCVQKTMKIQDIQQLEEPLLLMLTDLYAGKIGYTDLDAKSYRLANGESLPGLRRAHNGNLVEVGVGGVSMREQKDWVDRRIKYPTAKKIQAALSRLSFGDLRDMAPQRQGAIENLLCAVEEYLKQCSEEAALK